MALPTLPLLDSVGLLTFMNEDQEEQDGWSEITEPAPIHIDAAVEMLQSELNRGRKPRRRAQKPVEDPEAPFRDHFM